MFWKHKPLSEEIPLQDLTKIIHSKDSYGFNCYEKYDNIEQLVKFINDNYFYKKARFKFVYEEKHLEYFLRGGGWISIHSKKFPDIILGVIAYRTITLHNDENSSEVDFLCVKTNLRSINIAEFLIDKATELLIKQKNIYTSFFTGMDKRNIPFFCKKTVYLYILNFKKLMDMRYIPHILMENTKYNQDCIYYKECEKDEDYSNIHDIYNQVYRKEVLKKEDCFIDYIIFDKLHIFCRFMKIKVICRVTGNTLSCAILYYSNHSVDNYINNIAWLLQKTHGIDFITLYDPFENIPNKRQIFDTGLFMYYYSYNKKLVDIKRCSMSPV